MNCLFKMIDLNTINKTQNLFKNIKNSTKKNIVNKTIMLVQGFEATIQRLITADMVVVCSAENEKQTVCTIILIPQLLVKMKLMSW